MLRLSHYGQAIASVVSILYTQEAKFWELESLQFIRTVTCEKVLQKKQNKTTVKGFSCLRHYIADQLFT